MNDIRGSLRKELGLVKRYMDESEISLPDMQRPEILKLSQTSLDDAPDMVAIDGSYSILLSYSGIWVGVIRTVALPYSADSSGYIRNGQPIIREEGVAVSTDETVAMEQDDLHRLVFQKSKLYSSEPQREMMNWIMGVKEEQLAYRIAKDNKDTLIIMDGSLTPLKGTRTLEEVINAASDNDNTLVGFSKDSNIKAFGKKFTDEQFLTKCVDSPGFIKVPQSFQNQKGSEIYEGLKGDVYFSKLHQDSPKWFRVDLGNPKDDPQRSFDSLSCYSRSALCPGYPFPMMEAHRLAVVVRQMHGAYEDEVLSIAQEMGISLQDAMDGLTHVDGRSKAAFHEYLDKVSREMR